MGFLGFDSSGEELRARESEAAAEVCALSEESMRGGTKGEHCSPRRRGRPIEEELSSVGAIGEAGHPGENYHSE